MTYLTSDSKEVRDKFAVQAAKDWEQILQMRARELVSSMCLLEETATIKQKQSMCLMAAHDTNATH